MLCTSLFASTALASPDSSQPVIVEVPDGLDPAETARSLGIVPERVYRHAINGFAARVSPRGIQALSARNGMKVEPDQEYSINQEQSGAVWGIDRIDQRDLPLDRSYSFDFSGRGVSIYIFDTGIMYSHSEFRRDGSSRAQLGFDAWDGNGSDCNGHGTHVAGTTAGRGVGVAKDARIHSVRVINCGGLAPESAIIAGIDWLIERTRSRPHPAVANFSLSGPRNRVFDKAIRRLVDAGVVVIAAAGNQASDSCEYSPANVPEVLTVGATDSSDRKMSASNFGSCVDFFAPGVNIQSAGIRNNSEIVPMTGTSMAAPHAAGAAALFLERDPTASPGEVVSRLLSASTRGMVRGSQSRNNHLLYSLESL